MDRLKQLILAFERDFKGLTYDAGVSDMPGGALGRPDHKARERLILARWAELELHFPAGQDDALERAKGTIETLFAQILIFGVLNFERPEAVVRRCEFETWPKVADVMKDLLSAAQASHKRRKPAVDEDGDLTGKRIDKEPYLMAELRQWEKGARNRLTGELKPLPPIKYFYERCRFTEADAGLCKQRQPEFYRAYHELKSEQSGSPIRKRRRA